MSRNVLDEEGYTQPFARGISGRVVIYFRITHKIPFFIRLTFETNSAKLREYLAEQVKQQGYKYNRK